MESIANNISSYNIIANFIPGMISIIGMKYFLNFDITHLNNLWVAILAYFVGLIINRLGSIVIKMPCNILRCCKQQDYKLFIEAEKKDSKISILSETSNMYRSFATIFLIAICICFYKNISSRNMLPFLLGFALFLYSYIKQQKYINSLIKFSKEE